MFTIDQINQASSKIKSGADFPQFVQDLKEIGVTHYENFVSDGHTKYFGLNDYVVNGKSKYSEIPVNDDSSLEKLKHAIYIHQQGQTDYPTFCKQASEAGVEKWITHTIKMTVTYLDKEGKELIIEPIPKP
ncbi:MAG: DUF1398 domain-containing protein [Flavobacteriales bacterium]|nr:DUF1398 domain-containing protein [Flavobacteriales bacterium]